jgi:hypothetical protein
VVAEIGADGLSEDMLWRLADTHEEADAEAEFEIG